MAFEVSDGLIHKLMATKQRLLAGNAEAARAGAARAEPGAWMAANAEKNARKKGDGKGKTGKKGKDGKEMPGENDWDHVVVVHLFSWLCLERVNFWILDHKVDIIILSIRWTSEEPVQANRASGEGRACSSQ